MPEYLSVMTYLSYSDTSELPKIVQQYSQILERLGYAGQDIKDELSQARWEEEEDHFSYSLHYEVPFQRLQLAGHPLFANPIVHGWTSGTFPDLQEPWVSIDFACETQTERQDLDSVSSFSRDYAASHTYMPGVGRVIWQVMREFFATWGEPVWFTYEGQEDKAWLALLTGKGNLWDFQAALIPERLAHRFDVVPEGYFKADVPEGIGLAESARWPILPWNEGAL